MLAGALRAPCAVGMQRDQRSLSQQRSQVGIPPMRAWATDPALHCRLIPAAARCLGSRFAAPRSPSSHGHVGPTLGLGGSGPIAVCTHNQQRQQDSPWLLRRLQMHWGRVGLIRRSQTPWVAASFFPECRIPRGPHGQPFTHG